MLNRFKNQLITHAVFKVRRRQPVLGNSFEEVEYSVCKGVLVTDDMASRPPAFHVRISFAGYLDGSKATLQTFIEVKLELVHSLKIEHNASVTAVNLKLVVILSPGSEPGCFDRAHRP